MTDTLITVQGRFSAWYPAERATLRFAVGFDGADRSTVFSATTGSGEIVRNRIATIHDPRVGPITWWSSDNVQVWSDRPWNQHGLQLEPVFHARLGFTAKFSDFARLANFVEDAAELGGVSIGDLEWDLTETTRSAAIAEVRSRAVKDAVVKATIYAQSIGLGHVRAIALADAGMLGDVGHAASGYDDAREMRVTGAGGSGDGPALSLKPEEIEIEAVVDARFVAN